ncbi:GntR family transcriptional regulator [Rhodoferax sp.]|uniref:GntR family transcriptional regulator n=1 Tax=Rhodoferax sp. TaxID=50421 RepID=UPI00283FC179|nr:GntR family transcriptional regulator [Rhodoferax sp.]MDR3370285.1 GntR family transcriptional regulator [Rhodoferax sp.]
MSEPIVLTENEIYERMVATILDHRLPPGTKLIEDRLATAFGVSRTRIRPVLVRLANEQIVTLTPNRGATVAQPTEAEAREVFEVRRMIESTLITRFVTKASADDIAVLSQCIAQEEKARQAGDMRRAIRLSGDFHLHIANTAQHQTLGRILRELVSRTSLILMTYGTNVHPQYDASRCGCQEHRALLDAIRLRDAREAARLMGEHLAQLESQLQFSQDDADVPDLLSLFGAESASATEL